MSDLGAAIDQLPAGKAAQRLREALGGFDSPDPEVRKEARGWLYFYGTAYRDSSEPHERDTARLIWEVVATWKLDTPLEASPSYPGRP